MSMSGFCLRAAAASAGLRRMIYCYDTKLPSYYPLRKLSIFQDFTRKLKGEIDSNPELKKSMKDLKEKADELKSRTKETAEHLYKHVDAARGEAETRAKQVSSVIKEKISEATEQVKETVSSVKVKKDESSTPSSSPKDGQEASPKDDATGQEAKGPNPKADASQAGQEASPKDDPTSQAGQEASPKDDATSQAGQASSPKDDATEQEVKGPSNQSEQQAQTDTSSSARRPSSTGMLSGKLASVVGRVAKEGYNLLAEELTSTRRVKNKPTIPRSSATAVVPVVENKTGWRKRWDELKDKATEHPMFKRFKTVKEHPVVLKSHEIAEEMRDRWETSDNPVVHKIQDLNDSLFGETSTAAALKEIRNRDPSFSFPDFVLELQEDIRPILTAYLKGDFLSLRKKCAKEVVERCRAEHRALRSQGMIIDNKILYISDVEVKETKLIGNEPIIIVAFQTQQSYCVRDEKGHIKEGSMNDIRTVYYAWAMQPVPAEEMDPDEFTPRWQLREMQQLGVQAII